MSPESILDPASVPRISYAPNQEDILLDRVFGDHVGTYLDVGASASTVGSLTYFFYRRGWRGVNLAPDPLRHRELRSARPGDLNLPMAAWDANGEMPLYEMTSDAGLRRSTLSARVAAEHRAAGGAIAIQERRVPARTIRSLVEEIEIEPPDFLAIDAEGAADAVIRGMPLDRWRPGALVVEANGPGAGTIPLFPSPPRWEGPLLEHGYLFATFNGVYRFYLRDDLGDRIERLTVPVSVRDRFQRAEVAALQQQLDELKRGAIGSPSDAADWCEQCARLREERQERQERLERAERGYAFWQGEAAALLEALIAAQRTLRPYLLIDQLGIVPIGYRWARRLKPKQAS